MTTPKDCLLLSSIPVVDYLNDAFKCAVFGTYAVYYVVKLVRFIRKKDSGEAL